METQGTSPRHRAAFVALAAGGFYLVLLVLMASRYGWNPSCFLHIGEKSCSEDHADLPRGLIFYKDSYGYDGLHYYQLARDPFLLDRSTAAPFKTNKFITRHQRVLYPALAWGLAAGCEPWIPSAMLAVNGLALVVTVWILMTAAGTASGMFVLFSASLPALMIGLFYSLTEPVSLALVAGALLAYTHARFHLCAILLGLACLARETSVLFVGALAIDRAWERDGRRALILAAAAAPAFLFALWLTQRLQMPVAGIFPGDAMGWPFSGILRQLAADGAPTSSLWRAIPVWYGALWIFACAVATWPLLRAAGTRPIALAAGLHAAMLLCSSYQEVWATLVNTGRIAAGLSLSIAFMNTPAASAPAWARWLLIAALPLHAATLARLLMDLNLPWTVS